MIGIALAGQSNAQGNADESTVTLPASRADVSTWTEVRGYTSTETEALTSHGDGKWGLELSLCARLADVHGETVELVKVAEPGSSLSGDWDVSTGARWTQLLDAVTSAEMTVTDLVWVQGEEDAKTTAAQSYATNLTALIAAARTAWGAGLRVWVCLLTPNLPGGFSYRRAVRQGQREASRDTARTFDLAGYALQGDSVHFTGPALLAMGSDLADLIASPPTLRHGWRVFETAALAATFAATLSGLSPRPSDPALGGAGVRHGGGVHVPWSDMTTERGAVDVDSLGQWAVRIDEAAYLLGGKPHQDTLS